MHRQEEDSWKIARPGNRYLTEGRVSSFKCPVKYSKNAKNAMTQATR